MSSALNETLIKMSTCKQKTWTLNVNARRVEFHHLASLSPRVRYGKQARTEAGVCVIHCAGVEHRRQGL